MEDYKIVIDGILYLNKINENLEKDVLNQDEKETFVFHKVKMTNYLKRYFDNLQKDHEVSLLFLREHIEDVKTLFEKFNIDFNTNKDIDYLYSDIIIIMLDILDKYTLSSEGMDQIDKTFKIIINCNYNDAKVYAIYQALELLKFFDDEIYLENKRKHKFYYIVHWKISKKKNKNSNR